MLPLTPPVRLDVEDGLPWETEILHQEFFREAFTELADEDRSSLLCTNRLSAAVFLKYAQNSLFALNEVIDFTKTLVATEVTPSWGLREGDSLPKINDRFFAEAGFISQLLTILKPTQKMALRAHLLASREPCIRKLPRLLGLFPDFIEPIYSNLKQSFRFLKDLLILNDCHNQLVELKKSKRDVFSKLSSAHYDRTLLYFEVVDTQLPIWKLLSITFPKTISFVETLSSLHSIERHSTEDLINMGYIGEAVKNQFPKPLHPMGCIPLISSIAAAGHFNWAMKLTDIMVANLDVEYVEHKATWRDCAYSSISRSSGFNHVYYLIDLFQNPAHQYDVIKRVLEQAMAPNREYDVSKVLYLLPSKKCFTVALREMEHREEAVPFLQPLIEQACKEGEPEAALTLLEHLKHSRTALYQRTFRQISQALADKGDFERAHAVFKCYATYKA